MPSIFYNMTMVKAKVILKDLEEIRFLKFIY